MKKLIVAVSLVALGFGSAWESCARAWLPRIPQWDDHVITIGYTPDPPRLRVETPLGDWTPVCSVSIGAWDDPPERQLHWDGFAVTTSALYSYDREKDVWWTWTPMRTPILTPSPSLPVCEDPAGTMWVYCDGAWRSCKVEELPPWPPVWHPKKAVR